MEQYKYDIIKNLANDNKPNKRRAAIRLNITTRQVDRLLRAYATKGKEAFAHGNRNRKSPHAFSDDFKKHIEKLYQEKYYDANFTHFAELLREHENISISVSSIHNILEAKHIISPRATKAKRKHFKDIKKLQSHVENAPTTLTNIPPVKEPQRIETQNAHPRMPRAAYFGELVQMDASSFPFVPEEIWHLHLAIEDAKGTIVGAYFDTQETLNGYYNVTKQMIENYGIPYTIRTDRRTIFTYKLLNNSEATDTGTQFQYACQQLGINLEYTSVPQRKGRIERANETFQGRLPVELRIAGVKTIDDANEFLKAYIQKFNEQFAEKDSSVKSVFETAPSTEQLNRILAVVEPRTIDAGCCIKYKKTFYRLLDKKGCPQFFQKGTKVLVIKSFDGNLFCSVGDNSIYALEEIPKHCSQSCNFDVNYKKQEPKPRYIPPMNHPWRLSNYMFFLKSRPYKNLYNTTKCKI